MKINLHICSYLGEEKERDEKEEKEKELMRITTNLKVVMVILNKLDSLNIKLLKFTK